MSNQFYNYISSLIISYLKTEGLKPGDRYYLQLDSQKEVDQLIEAMSKGDNVVPFTYQHRLGDKYETFALSFNEHRLIVANTSPTVKPDFLVTLRNLVGEQEDEFYNTSLISVVSEQLDSIEGGSSNLQKEGMPLHPDSLFVNIEKKIENSSLASVEKVILKDHLEYLMEGDPFQQVTFFDFKSIFTTLEKGYIDENRYYEFGLFKDDDIASFPKNDQKKRLQANREFFDLVKRVHDYGLSKDELENKFSEAGAKELIKDDWYNLPYSKVNKYHQDYIEENKEIKVVLDEIKLKQKLTIWERPLNERAAGKRKRHIVIFNPNRMQEIDLSIQFSFTGKVSRLDKQYLSIGKQSQKYLKIDVKKNRLNVKFDMTERNATFVKFGYKHNKKATLGAEFFVAILPADSSYFEEYKSRYLVNVKQQALELKYEDEFIRLGAGEKVQIELNKYHQEVELAEGHSLTLYPLPEAFNDDDQLFFYINISDNNIPLLLTNELPDSTPITGQRIWKLIREKDMDMEWYKENNRLIIGNQEYYLHADYKTFFDWEDSFVREGIKCAEYDSDQLEAVDIELNDDLNEAYSRFVTYFQTKSIPSLCTVTNEFKDRAIEYIREYVKEVDSFENGSPAGKKGVDLFKLGTIKARDRLYFTPFHPLMVAYKIKYFETLGTEEIENNILSRLSPEALVPFIYDENRTLYKPEYQHSVPQWLVYKPVNQVSVSDANQYLANIVTDKITQFQTHFSYLFMEKSQAPFKINVINISNDIEVVKGILRWMVENLNKNSNNLKPVEITLYKKKKDVESSLDVFSRIDNVSEFEDFFDIKLKAKGFDAEDVLGIIREKVSFYKRSTGSSYRYAHITFYKMEEQEHMAVQQMDKMISGITIDGLYSSVPSMKDEETYLSGFGTKAYDISSENLLTNTAYYLNELAANLRNGGNDSYRKGEGIFSRTTNADEETLKEIFESSHWITFVDPSIDLEFFNKFDDNLVVIHYSDQYSSSSRYDAITVTNKSNQYFAVIKEFLEQKDLEGTIENVRNAVQAFNMFNGEWLLRIIGSKGHSAREKLSVISAIKYALTYLDHPDILWIPISLEEVLRVAGAANLNKSDGVFTAKNLGVKGAHSDDLLLIGLEKTSDEILLYFYPVEVKIGINANSVLDKARTQVLKTKKLILDSLTGEKGNTFEGRFYRNFFVQLLIANARKLYQNNFWDEKGYHLSDDIIEKLLKDDYQITNKLVPYIGEGAVLSFQKDAYHRSAELEGNVLLINLIEYDGYSGLIQSINEMRNWIQDQPNDFIKEDMLSYNYKVINKEYTDIKGIETQNGEIVGVEEVDEHPDCSVTDELIDKPSLENVRLLLGTAQNSNRKIYWEYGHKGLANRHLLISGKSGQGKTYFMQCLLLEASKHGIPNIVVDYTEGFLPNQLEPEFIEYLGDKVKQKIVYKENFPINPFAKSNRDIGGIQLLETNTDVAERIKSVFAAVYDKLGIQQQNAIYDATIKGLERYGKHMDLQKLKEILEEDKSSYAKTALSQIRALIDRNPFDVHNTIDWKDIIESDGEIFIIQLTGFSRDVQLIITEFILWDLWNYSIRYGNKNIPIPVILDEAQNLDHRENSPSARILTEGRKFGWSAWYATQFLKAQLDADELARLQNSSQKIYFSPPDVEISHVASTLAKDSQERKEWERKLANLKKGQCIVQGPVLQPNGELSAQTVNIVNITPLQKRIL